MSEPFAVSRNGGVARVAICREAVRNALRITDLQGLARLVDALDKDDAIRVIVLTGSGTEAFCAGLDLTDADGMASDFRGTGPTALGALVRRANLLSKPLVGRVNGACVGGGMGLLAMCDVTIALDQARFGFPEMSRGIFPFVATAAWQGRLPLHRLNLMALDAGLISAQRAQQMGIVHEVAPHAGLDARIETVCGAVLATGPQTAKRLLGHWRAGRAAAELDAKLAWAERDLRASSAANLLTVDSKTNAT